MGGWGGFDLNILRDWGLMNLCALRYIKMSIRVEFDNCYVLIIHVDGCFMKSNPHNISHIDCYTFYHILHVR